MNRNIFVISLLFVLAACDADKSKTELDQVAQQEKNSSVSRSDTGLYIQGGGGIDFGRKPDNERIEKESVDTRVKRLLYKFPDSAEKLYLAMDKVLTDQGYKGKLNKQSKNSSSYTYAKNGERFNFVITESATEGFSKKSTLVFWVREKK